MRFLTAGDRGLVVEFGNEISEEINNQVHAFAGQLASKKIKGIIEVVPTFRSLMIYYDPDSISYSKLVRILSTIQVSGKNAGNDKKKVLQIPCCYEAPFGEDLTDMEQILGLSKQEIIQIHSSTNYKVYMLGFLPGFVYLGGLDPRIETPRLKTPRVKIDAGSVGIGGNQTGVYPVPSPGGWRLIGNTPVKFYDPNSKEPFLCQAGEYIHFVPISYEEYQHIEQLVAAGRYQKEYTEV